MTYMGGPYYPWWLDNLADDATLEAAAMNGAAQGAEAVRSITVTAREIHEDQEFSFAGDYGDNGFLELCTAQVRGEPTSVVVMVTSNAAGQAQHVVVNHRPRSSVLLISRLLGEKFAGPPGQALPRQRALNRCQMGSARTGRRRRTRSSMPRPPHSRG